MKHNFYIVLAIILALLLRLFLSVTIYSGDVNNHIAWGAGILKFGSFAAYDRDYVGVMAPTYPPLALYAFTTSYWAYDNLNQLTRFLNDTFSLFPSGLVWFFENQNVLPAFHKIISMVSDIGIGILIYLLSRRVMRAEKATALAAMCLYLFNPAVIYNSTLWGQLESIPLFWILLAVWLVVKTKPLWGHAAFVMALLFKQTALIFTPVFVLFSIFKAGWKKTLLGLGLQFFIFYLAYLPFFRLQLSTINYPLLTYISRLQTGSGSDYISDHAFNLWALYTHLEKISDSVVFLPGISVALFAKIIFVAISLFLISKYLLYGKNTRLISLLGLIGFTAFMVLTRMHERYLAPAIPFLAISASRHRELWPIYFLVSVGHLINLYHLWWFPNLPVLVPLISQWGTIVGVIIILAVSWVSWVAVYLNEDRH